MYGTIARMRLKPGMEQRMKESMRQYEARQAPGHIAAYIYRMDADTNTYMLAVIFKDRESYFANASSPEQDAMYRELLGLLEGEPEWHDGEIVHYIPATTI